MKKTFVGALMVLALIAFAGCMGGDKSSSDAKCGEGKCGADTKVEKCGNNTGKCGGDK